ncbi:MAG: hypothetical protein QW404_01785 [Candidatus Nanoarchaeia archaeon]
MDKDGKNIGGIYDRSQFLEQQPHNMEKFKPDAEKLTNPAILFQGEKQLYVGRIVYSDKGVKTENYVVTPGKDGKFYLKGKPFAIKSGDYISNKVISWEGISIPLRKPTTSTSTQTAQKQEETIPSWYYGFW